MNLNFKNLIYIYINNYLIRLFFFSEFIVFITLFVSYLYFIFRSPVILSISYIDFDKFYSLDLMNFSIFTVFLLSLILFYIKSSFYFFKSVFFYNLNKEIAYDFLFSSLLISLIFIFVQGFEFFILHYSFLDCVFSSYMYSILFLHFIHVIVGCFLFILFFVYIII